MAYQQKNSRNPANLLTWSILRRPWIRPGTRFDLPRHPYLAAIYLETARSLTINKAGQMGVSEYGISYVTHACDVRQATSLYIFPTDKNVSDFSSARFGPAIEASDYLSRIVVEGGQAGGKRGADRITLKRVRDRFLYFRGAKVSPEGNAPQLKSIDADVIVLDELDEMDSRALDIARKRLGHSQIAEERLISTPTYHGLGIHAEWLETDQRLWHVQCAACREWQPLTLANVVIEFDQLDRPVAWHGGPDDAWCACRKCGQRLNRLGAGRWVATYPDRDRVGYHLSRLFSHYANLRDILKNLQTTDETKRKETYNQDLGEPYTPKGSKITDTVLDECRREYGHAPVAGRVLVMGVDVGKVLHGVIRTMPDAEGGTIQCWAGEIDTWAELGRIMRQFGVAYLVIDALPETTKAREFQAGWRKGVVWLAYYTSQGATKWTDSSAWDVASGVVNLDRTRTLDEMFSGFYDGLSTLPGDIRRIKDYYSHLKAPIRSLESGAGGQLVARYVEETADHFAHAENYCRVAMSAAQANASSGTTRSRSVKVTI